MDLFGEKFPPDTLIVIFWVWIEHLNTRTFCHATCILRYTVLELLWIYFSHGGFHFLKVALIGSEWLEVIATLMELKT